MGIAASAVCCALQCSLLCPPTQFQRIQTSSQCLANEPKALHSTSASITFELAFITFDLIEPSSLILLCQAQPNRHQSCG